MELTWLTAAIWMGMALLAALISIRMALSVAVVEICVGIAGGNLIDMQTTPWIDFLASFGGVLLTFLAGSEIDPGMLRSKWKETLVIGITSFLLPCVCIAAFTYWVVGWSLQASQISGLSLAATAAVLAYTVMVERGYTQTDVGKIILGAGFITNLLMALGLGLLYARYDRWLTVFLAATAVSLWVLPRLPSWVFARAGSRFSEPESKFIFVILFGLGALAAAVKSEAVLPAFLVGVVLAPLFLANQMFAHRMRVIAFSLITPFFFLKAGTLVSIKVVIGGAVLVVAFLTIQMASKLLAMWAVAPFFRFSPREVKYLSLMMSTTMVFATVALLYGLTHELISRDQYSILLSVVILAAVVPTTIADLCFSPGGAPTEETLTRRAADPSQVTTVGSAPASGSDERPASLRTAREQAPADLRQGGGREHVS